MHLHSQSCELIAMQPPRRIVANLPHIPRLQSPHRARRHRRRHLPTRQHVRRPKRHLRPAFRILRHRNNRVRSIQPHPNQIHSRPHLHPAHSSQSSSSYSVSSSTSVVNPLVFRFLHSTLNRHPPTSAHLSVLCVIFFPSPVLSLLHYFVASLRRLSSTGTPSSSQSPPRKPLTSPNSPPSTPPPPPNKNPSAALLP